MKKTNKLLAMLAIAVATLVPFKSFAQQSAVPQQVAEMYPAAATVNDLGAWSAVLDNAGATLGYYAYSKPASDSIQGFNGETPLLVIFDNEKKGLTIDQALEKEVDAVSGATFTSNGVKASLKACLQNIKANESATTDSCSNIWLWVAIGAAVLLVVVICLIVARRRKN